MRSLVLLIAVTLAPTLDAQERFLYEVLPAYNQPGPSPFYFDNGFSPSTGNTYQQPFGNNRFPSTPDISPPSYDYGSQQPYSSNTLVSPYASNNFPQSNGFTSFSQTLGLNPFNVPQQTANAVYQQPIRPFEGFGRFEGNQPFSSYVSPFPGFLQNNQGFGVNQGSVAPPQFLFPTATNQQFDPSPFRNIPNQVNQLPAQQPQFPAQQPQFPTQQPQFPTQQPQFPAQQPQFPTQQPQFPAQQPQFPAQQPQFPVQQPQFPVQQPQQPFQNTNPFQQSQFPISNPFQLPQPQPQTTFPTTTGTEVTQPTPSGQPPSPPSQGNQLRPIKGIFGPGQPGQFDAPKEYVIPL